MRRLIKMNFKKLVEKSRSVNEAVAKLKAEDDTWKIMNIIQSLDVETLRDALKIFICESKAKNIQRLDAETLRGALNMYVCESKKKD